MEPIITLTTDFGLVDAYIAAMKGVILSINPRVKLVDICHSIPPQNIREAAFIFSTANTFFPIGTIHLVVVDPGVGTARRAIILKTPTAFFVAPDNGVLSYAIEPFLASRDDESTELHQVELRAEAEVFNITNPRFWHSPVSGTFHGRDIFGPVAAHLSLGVLPREFGKRLNTLTMLPLPHPVQDTDGSVIGHVIHIDSFGNLITDIKRAELAEQAITVEVGNRLISGLSRTYSEGDDLLVLMGSSGYLEVALKKGNAAHKLHARVGDTVRLRHLSHV